MAHIIVCDRCGAECTALNLNPDIRMVVIKLHRHHDHADFCEPCYTHVLNAVRNAMFAAPPEPDVRRTRSHPWMPGCELCDIDNPTRTDQCARTDCIYNKWPKPSRPWVPCVTCRMGCDAESGCMALRTTDGSSG